ncbi:hypothetical protein [Natribaculum luteum]|uniref:hypothetical protein n=1 Tax=Natribaculum luteum TaxID=1586232 RepID=UPI003670D2C2
MLDIEGGFTDGEGGRQTAGIDDVVGDRPLRDAVVKVKLDNLTEIAAVGPIGLHEDDNRLAGDLRIGEGVDPARAFRPAVPSKAIPPGGDRDVTRTGGIAAFVDPRNVLVLSSGLSVRSGVS